MSSQPQQSATTAPPISGFTATGYESVKEAFAKNFLEEQEVGGAVCVFVKGRKVVDLWGGHKDVERCEPWLEETIANVWSTTKGAAAACVAHLVQSDQLALHAPVADYWPEFATAGKQRVTVAQLFSHQAGLCGPAKPITFDQIFDLDGLANLFAAETPHWTPGTHSGYHALSIGYLAEGLFKRVVGITVGEYFRRHIAEPLGLEFYMGMTDQQAARAAHMMHDGEPFSGGPGKYNAYEALTFVNFPLDQRLVSAANEKSWRVMGLPSAGAAASARGVASLYAALLSDLAGRTVHIASKEVLRDMLDCQIEGDDLVLRVPIQWGVGFALNGNTGMYGPTPSAFGHHGWGGSFGFADPVDGVSLGYTTNYMREAHTGDRRAANLIQATFNALGK